MNTAAANPLLRDTALVLEALRPDPAPLAVTHVGGAGMTLARWVHRVHPGSPQIVLEPGVQRPARLDEGAPEGLLGVAQRFGHATTVTLSNLKYQARTGGRRHEPSWK